MGRNEWDSSVQLACWVFARVKHSGSKGFLLLSPRPLLCLFPNIQAASGYLFFWIFILMTHGYTKFTWTQSSTCAGASVRQGVALRLREKGGEETWYSVKVCFHRSDHVWQDWVVNWVIAYLFQLGKSWLVLSSSKRVSYCQIFPCNTIFLLLCLFLDCTSKICTF